MTGPWYAWASADDPLTQGDIVQACRVMAWEPVAESAALQAWANERSLDVVVMTQACDLEHRKVANVVFCPFTPISIYREVWNSRMLQRSQIPSEKAWRRALQDIAAGYVWNQTLLESFEPAAPENEPLVVDFQEIFTVPRRYVEGLLAQRGQPRPRLLPPYREFLSQAFARYFMRIGLPQNIKLD